MKKTMNIRGKLLALLFALLFGTISSMMYADRVEAKGDISWLKKGVDTSKKQIMYVAPKDTGEWRSECLFPLSKNISANKVKNVKSSNPKVLKIKEVYNEKVGKKKAVVLDIYLLKPGMATVFFKYNSKTYEVHYEVKKMGNGLKSLKLGGYSKNYASKFNSSRSYYENKAAQKPTNIQVKTKKNWVVKNIYLISVDLKDTKSVFSSGTGKTSVTVKDKSFSTEMNIRIDCVNKKTKEEEHYILTLWHMPDWEEEDY